MYETMDRLEDWLDELISRLSWLSKEATFRARVATGAWRGVTIEANRKGKLTDRFGVYGLVVCEGDDEIKIARNEKEVLVISANPTEILGCHMEKQDEVKKLKDELVTAVADLVTIRARVKTQTALIFELSERLEEARSANGDPARDE